ncbi:MAG: hypothetical protein JSW73_03625 [Candidatus Woesearchaeota archaeon]|nr:MAG: hypothetical protein JSW73_03625 [Candidatus Woesearchaeota archaeon]
MNWRILVPLFIIFIIFASGCTETGDLSIDDTKETEKVVEEMTKESEEDCVWAYDTANLREKCKKYCGAWSFKTASKAYDSSSKCEIDRLDDLEKEMLEEIKDIDLNN